MPDELRRLVFKHSELAEALNDYGQKHNVTFPPGKIIKAKFASEAEYELHTERSKKQQLAQQYNVEDKHSAIIVTFFDEFTFEHKYFNLTPAFLSAALIHYCVGKNIPLPRAGRKRLDVTEFNVCLDIIIGEDAEALAKSEETSGDGGKEKPEAGGLSFE